MFGLADHAPLGAPGAESAWPADLPVGSPIARLQVPRLELSAVVAATLTPEEKTVLAKLVSTAKYELIPLKNVQAKAEQLPKGARATSPYVDG